MSITQAQARNAVMKHFTDAWAPTTHFAAYQDLPKEPPDNVRKNLLPWARACIDFDTQDTASIGGADGATLWRNQGMLKIQIFTASGTGAKLSDTLVQLLLAKFRGSKAADGEVWFQRIQQDQGPDGAWWMHCLYIQFVWHERVEAS
jgi:hypothetical protein